MAGPREIWGHESGMYGIMVTGILGAVVVAEEKRGSNDIKK
jgi:hypothetical protein